jgi:hypothetical protein
MKLNRGLLAAVVATFVVGSVAVVGFAGASDEGDVAQLAPSAQAGAEVVSTVAGDVGVEKDARGFHGGGFHGGGWGHAGWGRGWDRGGWARGGRWGGWDWRRNHRYSPWW